MQRRAASAILTLIAVALWSGAPLLAEGGKPKAVIAEPVQDLGAIPVSDKVNVTFTIRNEGDAELKITEVRPSCGCTVADFDPTIPPGGSGEVRASLDTTNLNGPNSKTLTVFTNDSDNPAITLTIKGEVRPFIAAIPGYARFITVRNEAEGMVAQTLWSQDGNDFDVIGVDTPEPFITATFRPAKDDEKSEQGKGRQWRVEIKLAADAPVGALRGYVTVKTNHPKQSAVKLPISGFVRPLLAVTPPVADFQEVEITAPLRTSMTVRNFASEEIHLTSVESSLPAVKAEIVPLEDGRRYQLKLEVSPEMAKGPFTGRLMIKTDSPKEPQLEVEVKGTAI